MNGSMQGGVNGNGTGQMPPMQGQMGMNAMGMGRMPMGPDQVQAALIQLHSYNCIKTRHVTLTYLCMYNVFYRSTAEAMSHLCQSWSLTRTRTSVQ